MISGNEKLKAQKIVSRIEDGRFDELDIDSLFMRLRAHSKGYQQFMEVANFSAHNDKRDRGIVNEKIYENYLNLLYFVEYPGANKPLSLYEPFPSYIVNLLKFKIHNHEKRLLIKKFDIPGKSVLAYIDSIFSIDVEGDLARPSKRLGENDVSFVAFLLGAMVISPAISHKTLIRQIVSVVKLNGLKISEHKFLAQSDRIGICVLAMLHNTNFSIGQGGEATCQIHTENQSIPYEFWNAKGNLHYQNFGGFGNIGLIGTFKVPSKGNFVSISCPIFDIDLKVDNCCDETLFDIFDVENSGKFVRILFDKELTVSDEFKLIEIEKN